MCFDPFWLGMAAMLVLEIAGLLCIAVVVSLKQNKKK